MDNKDDLHFFGIWFVDPIEKLKELPGGNGGFVAMMVGLALYERLIVAKLKQKGKDATLENQNSLMAKDLGISENQVAVFWDVFRNGLLHQAMPKEGKTKYVFNNSFGGHPVFKTYAEAEWICIDPWDFTSKVIQEFLDNPNLLGLSLSFPLTTTTYLPPELLGP